MPRIVCVRSLSLPTTTPSTAHIQQPCRASCLHFSTLPVVPFQSYPVVFPFVRKLHPTSNRAPGPICQTIVPPAAFLSQGTITPIRGHHFHLPSNTSTIRMVGASTNINRSDRSRRFVTHISHPSNLLPNLIPDLRKSHNCIVPRPRSFAIYPCSSRRVCPGWVS